MKKFLKDRFNKIAEMYKHDTSEAYLAVTFALSVILLLGTILVILTFLFPFAMLGLFVGCLAVWLIVRGIVKLSLKYSDNNG